MESNDRDTRELETATAPAEDESMLIAVGLPLLALMITTAALYLAANVIIPVVAALILALVLSPIATRLERLVGRFFGAAIVVLTVVSVIGIVAYFTTVELTLLADEIAGYSNNIGNKLAAIEKSTPAWLQHIEYAVTDVKERVQKPSAPLPKPGPTVTVSTGTFADNLTHFMPALAAMVEILLVIVLLFFLLYSRRDLRDRFVRLAARARITVASQAVETAGRAIGRYLLLFSMINLGFGIAVGLVLWALGLPNPEFWGLLAFLFRFVPYVGAAASSLLPAAVAFAVFPGWTRSLEVIGALVVLDQITAHLVEPFAIGSGIDMSPVALLISTIYWSWIWGVPGLLMAIPLSACLKVAGEHIPALNFLTLLLGGERELEGYHEFYRMLLELDSGSASALAVRYCDENGLEETFDHIVSPALSIAGKEHTERHISDDNFHFMLNFAREIIAELGSRLSERRPGWRPRVLGVCPAEEVHVLGLLMVLELFRSGASAATKFLGEGKSADEACELISLFSPDLICLSCTVTECLPAAAELTKTLKARFPRLTIIAGGVGALAFPAELLRAGCSQVCVSRSQTRRAIRQLASGRRGRFAPAPVFAPTESQTINTETQA